MLWLSQDTAKGRLLHSGKKELWVLEWILILSR